MKKTICVILGALVLGGTMAFFVFKNAVKAEKQMDLVTITAFQIGAYKTEENAYKVAQRNNGVVRKDSDYYRVYGAFACKEETVANIMDYYTNLGVPYYIQKVSMPINICESSKIYEELINKSNKETYTKILADMMQEIGSEI